MSRLASTVRGCALGVVLIACGPSPEPPQAGSFGTTGVGASAGMFSSSGGSGTAGPQGSGGSDSGPFFDGISKRAERAVPLVGGTLLVTRDGTTAVAADPDRDRVFLIDLHDLTVRAIEAPSGSVPGRVVEGAAGSVFVVAQASGQLLAIDLASASLTWQSSVCGAPRALDYDAATDSVYVACRSGRVAVVSASSGQVQKLLQFDDDLIDILVQDSSLVLARRRQAELVMVAADGSVRRGSPTAPPLIASNGFRVRRLPSGVILTTHTVASVGGEPLSSSFTNVATAAVSMTPALPASLPLPVMLPVDPRDQAVAPVRFDSQLLGANVGPFDLAVSPDGARFAMLSLGDAWSKVRGSLYVGPIDAGTGRVSEGFWVAATGSASLVQRVEGEPVALAFDAKGRVLVQSREPAALVLENGVFVSLSEESRSDSSLALFYTNLGSGAACATCHPAAADDGRSWLTTETEGPLRTQSLEGGTVAQSPYLRLGTLPSFHFAALRMITDYGDANTISRFSAAQFELLGEWLGDLPKPARPDDLDSAAAKRGETLFTSEGCATCHSGEFWSDARLHDVGGASDFITPKLTGLAGHAPYFHDGCARSLSDLFGLCGDSVHKTTLVGSARADLLEFLRSL